MKTTLKHILQVQLNDEEAYGKKTHIMIWSPVDHCWIFEETLENYINPEWYKFLLKQEVMRISLRNDMPNNIAIYLRDYGKEKNRKLKRKFGR